MHEHTTIPCPHQQLLTEDPLTEVVRQGAGRVLDVEMNCDRAINTYASYEKLKEG